MTQATGAAVLLIAAQFHLVMLLSSSVTFVNHISFAPVTRPCLTAGGLGDSGLLKDNEQAEVSLPHVVRAQTS